MFILRRYLRAELAGIKWNARPTSNGIGGRNHVEWVADFEWNQWPAWTGIRSQTEKKDVTIRCLARYVGLKSFVESSAFLPRNVILSVSRELNEHIQVRVVRAKRTQ